MKNYKNSDYAANKFAGGIVYRFADSTIEVTLQDYLRENPGKTEADFTELKALSDEIYSDQSRDINRQTYLDVSLGGLEETDMLAVSSPDEALIDIPEKEAEKKRKSKLAKQALDTLTETQRRRYIQYHIKGLLTREIADNEGVSHVAVVYSLEWAEKKIKKYLTNL